MTPTILVVEDEPAIQELLAVNLKHNRLPGVRAGSAEECRFVIRAALPDLADSRLDAARQVLAWRWPKSCAATSGPANCRSSCSPPASTKKTRFSGLEAGADDYITKPFSPKELVARVRAVLRRRAAAPGRRSRRLVGDLSLNPATHRVIAGGQPVELGPTEFRLLLLLHESSERVYSRAQLLDEVWGDHVFIEERTVDVHIRRLRADAGADQASTSASKPCAAPAIASVEIELADETVFLRACPSA
jgi:two-component system phosphate regulon response regulator PhoB